MSNFSFPQCFIYIYIFVKCGCSNYFFLNSANLICRGTDISKYFRESLGIRDNENRLQRGSNPVLRDPKSEVPPLGNPVCNYVNTDL